MKKMMFFVVMMATFAFGQITTGRINFDANGSSVDATVVNSGNPAYVVMNGATPSSNPCAGTPMSGLPQMYSAHGGDVLFSNVLKRWSYPDNVTITSLTVRFCYTVSGWVYETIGVGPVYRNKLSGITYEGPAPIVVAGPSPGYYGAYYQTFPGTQPSVAQVTWTFSSTGTPNISSLDTNGNNIELGFRVGPANWSPFLPDTSAIKIFGVDVRATFAQSTGVPGGAERAAILNYTSNPTTFESGTLTINQPMPSPSYGLGILLAVRCAGGIYNQFGSIDWGTVNTRTYSLATLNNVCPSGQKLTRGSVTTIRSTFSNGTGGVGYSSSILLN